MKSQLTELKVDSQNPFANCKLERQQNAEILTQVVSHLICTLY